jgi:hypothetical protein
VRLLVVNVNSENGLSNCLEKKPEFIISRAWECMGLLRRYVTRKVITGKIVACGRVTRGPFGDKLGWSCREIEPTCYCFEYACKSTGGDSPA